MTGRLLVVDDEANLRALYEQEFADEGFTVRTVATAAEALDAARGESFDAVVLDIRLDDERDERNGLTVLGELRRLAPGLPVVINSAYPTFKTDFTTWLADAFVVKSPNVDELVAAVRQAIARRAEAGAG